MFIFIIDLSWLLYVNNGVINRKVDNLLYIRDRQFVFDFYRATLCVARSL